MKNLTGLRLKRASLVLRLILSMFDLFHLRRRAERFQTLWPSRRSDTNESNGNVEGGKKKGNKRRKKTGACGAARFISSLTA